MARPQRLNNTQLQRAIDRATKRLVDRLALEYTNEISADKWKWVDGRFRDIVDTGRLRASQTVRQVGEARYQFSWPVEYAAQVHEGAKLKDGRELPARPWTRTALESLDAKKYFETILRRELDG